MAEQLTYAVPPAPLPGAREEFEKLIETLHESGTLRVLNGFFGRIGAVTDTAVTELDTPPGRNLLAAVLFVGECLTRVSPDDLNNISASLAHGVTRARPVLEGEPPGTLGLLRLMHDPDTRRALAALLVLLGATGAALRHK